jgi:hypothetical protein
LVYAPDGHLLGLSTQWVQHSVFGSYLVPGLYLLLVLGVWSVVLALLLWKRIPLRAMQSILLVGRQYWPTWHFALFQVAFLWAWLLVQVVTIQQLNGLQGFYAGFGALILVTGLLRSVRVHYRTPSTANG